MDSYHKTRPAAIVTGASHGIGAAVAARLLDMDYKVYGFGRKFMPVHLSCEGSPEGSPDASSHSDGQLLHNSSFKGSSDNDQNISSSPNGRFPALTFGNSSDMIQNPLFHPVEGDLLDTQWLTQEIKKILKEEPHLQVLVNNAGCAWYGLHEEMNAQKISAMVRTNLEVPMILAQLLLRRLKSGQGTIINISSVTAEEAAPHGAAYGATKAGLLSFSRSLFAENRKYGLKVSCILPDLTDTELYRNADFRPSGNPGCSLKPDDVADAVEYILTRPSGVAVPELMLRPQKNQIVKKDAGHA